MKWAGTLRCMCRQNVSLIGLVVIALMVGGCSSVKMAPGTVENEAPPAYLIGPGDNVQIFVWGNSELSATVPVRPDGMITTPLVEDVVASGMTPTLLAREMEKQLSKYIKSPVVTVIVTGFVGRFSEQIRVVGEAAQPQSLPYKDLISVLDVMITVGGLTEFAAGNKATVVRMVDGQQQQYRVRLDDLLKEGDISANMTMLPGDILIIPEAWF